jgi:hypothetical protein
MGEIQTKLSVISIQSHFLSTSEATLGISKGLDTSISYQERRDIETYASEVTFPSDLKPAAYIGAHFNHTQKNYFPSPRQGSYSLLPH